MSEQERDADDADAVTVVPEGAQPAISADDDTFFADDATAFADDAATTAKVAASPIGADDDTFFADADAQTTAPEHSAADAVTPGGAQSFDAKLPGAGDRIGEDFEVIRLIGSGGMGAVFLGRDLRLGRKVAIKLMRLEGRDTAARERMAGLFEGEARATARLNHPNVVTIHQVGRAFGLPYLVLELLQGVALSDRLAQGPMSIEEGVRVLCEVCRALIHAHGQGLVHRDLKPQNIFLTNDGQVKVVDFGLASFDPSRVRATGETGRRRRETLSDAFEIGSSSGSSAIAGSPAYMAPEQWRGQTQDARTDLWACGVILYQLLTGSVPFARPLDVLGDKPIPKPADRAPDTPPALAAIVARCMCREPGERFQDAGELLSALQAWQSGARSDPGGAPYRFLEAFGEADAGWFFGRDRETAQLAHMLQRRPLLAIVGPSGAGKSSLARAGVLGRLRARGEAWQSVVMVPGRHPLRTLRTRLAALSPEHFAARGGDDVDLRARPGFVGEVLREHARTAGVRIALLVDQFEEVVTLTEDVEERAAFAAALLSAADDPEGPIRVIVTMRDDFLAPLGALPALRDAIVGSLFALGPPDEAGMARAVQGPAQAAGFDLEEGLAEAMVADLRGEAAPLPLLQFAASQLWERRDRERRRMTLASLEELGGVAGVLAAHAEGLVAGMDAGDLDAAKRVLCALVTPAGTRRAVRRGELEGAFAEPRVGAEVLDRLISGRLLTVSRDAGAAVVQLAHESLIGRWERLRHWLDDDADRRHVAERLRDAATHWRDAGEPREMLWGGAPLLQADAAFADAEVLPELERAFLRASRRAERRSRSLRRGATIAVVLAALAVAAGSSVAMLKLREKTDAAQRAEQTATAAAEQARKAERHAREEAIRAERARREGFARVLAAWSNARAEKDAMAALLLAREAVALASLPQTIDALSDAIAASLERRVLAGQAKISHTYWDARGLFTVGADGLVRRFSDDGHAEAATRTGIEPSAATLIPDGPAGEAVAVAAESGEVVVVDARGGHRALGKTGAAVRALASDGQVVAAAGVDGTLTLLALHDAQATPRAIAVHRGEALTLAWLAGRGAFVSGGSDGELRQLRPHGPSGPAGASVRIGRHGDAVISLATDAGGQLLASGSLDGTVGLWPVRGPPKMLRGHDGWVTALAVSHDGALVASGSNDESVRLWRADGTFLNRIEEHDYGISALHFAPGGTRLLTVSLDGSAAIFGADGKRIARLSGHEQPLLDGVWAPDGRHVVTGSEDRSARIWATRPAALGVMRGAACEVGRAVVAPAGDAVVAFGEGDLFEPCPPGPLRRWERPEHVGEDRAPRLLPAPEHAVRDLSLIGGGAMISIGADGTARRLDRDGAELGVVPGSFAAVVGDADGAALASRDATLVRLDARGNERGRTRGTGGLRALQSCGSGAAMLLEDGSALGLTAHGTPQRAAAWAQATSLGCAPLAAGGLLLLRGGSDGGLRLQAGADETRIATAHPDAVAATAVLAASGDQPALLLSADRGGNLRAASAEAPRESLWQVRPAEGPVLALALDRGGRRVVALGADGVGRVYAADGSLEMNLRAHEGAATGVAIAADGSVAALVVRGTGAALLPMRKDALVALAEARSSRVLRPAEREAVGLAADVSGTDAHDAHDAHGH
ncbi:MAG: protein kinase [Deltaproteobacteria bacterium]|nr:protein kinase [Deltaproteobacteria bacterium]